MRAFFVALLVVACGSAEAGPDPNEVLVPPSYLDDPSGELPATVRELGLYPEAGRFDTAHPRAVEFVPACELWSNGSTKQRFLVLPPGTTVDNSNRAAWDFPEGALFLKTFFFGAPVETRVLRRTEQGFEYAVYLWNEDGTDAELTSIDRPIPKAVEVDGESFEHVVPSRLDCRKCHESQEPTVIGFDELRLNAPREAGAPTQLEDLASRGVFGAPIPADPDAIRTGGELTDKALCYLHGNCAHCHNGGSGASSAFDMRHPVALENLINRETEGEALSGIRVVPGEPEQSTLYRALTREVSDGIQPMPPVGVQRVDTEGIALIYEFIENLPTLEESAP